MPAKGYPLPSKLRAGAVSALTTVRLPVICTLLSTWLAVLGWCDGDCCFVRLRTSTVSEAMKKQMFPKNTAQTEAERQDHRVPSTRSIRLLLGCRSPGS